MRCRGRAALWNEWLAIRELRQLVRDPLFAGDGIARGRGRAVLVIPGYLSTDMVMQTPVRWLRRLGYRASYTRELAPTTVAARSW
jgi:hypothetical protein